MHAIKQKIFQTTIKAEDISDDVGSNGGILKILGVKFVILCQRIVLIKIVFAHLPTFKFRPRKEVFWGGVGVFCVSMYLTG